MHLAFATFQSPAFCGSSLSSSSFTTCSQRQSRLVATRLRLESRRFATMTAATAGDETSNATDGGTDVDTIEPVGEGESGPAVAEDPNRKKGILMLCWGNICRSPAAEAVMTKVLADRGLSDKYFVDSCGTGGGSPDWYMEDGFSHHQGSPPDIRMQYAAEQRGYVLDSRSRPLTKADFEQFEYIVAMDSSNIESIKTAREHWGVDENAMAKVKLMSEFSTDEKFRGKGVPDPYYSGQDGFDYALDLILDSCNGIAEFLKPAESSSA